MSFAARYVLPFALTFASLATVAAAAPTTTANPVRGRTLFLQCQACHSVAPGAAHSVGPNLVGIFGAKAASRPGYAYSPALTNAKLVWNVASLEAFLKRPTKAVPGTKMTSGSVANDQARSDLIAYLATLKSKR